MVADFECLQDGFSRANGVGVGCGMSAAKIAKTEYLRRRKLRAANNPAYADARPDTRHQRLDHGVSGLTDPDHENSAIGCQIMQVFDDPKDTSLVEDMAIEGSLDAGFSQNIRKDFSSGIARLARHNLVDRPTLAIHASVHCVNSAD